MEQKRRWGSLVNKYLWCKELTHWKRLWCWEGLGAGGEGDDRDGWMASLTRWMWVWVNSGRWWWTGRPGVLRFMGLRRVGHDWATELNQRKLCEVTFEQRPEKVSLRARWDILGECVWRQNMYSESRVCTLIYLFTNSSCSFCVICHFSFVTCLLFS